MKIVLKKTLGILLIGLTFAVSYVFGLGMGKLIKKVW